MLAMSSGSEIGGSNQGRRCPGLVVGLSGRAVVDLIDVSGRAKHRMSGVRVERLYPFCRLGRTIGAWVRSSNST